MEKAAGPDSEGYGAVKRNFERTSTSCLHDDIAQGRSFFFRFFGKGNVTHSEQERLWDEEKAAIKRKAQDKTWVEFFEKPPKQLAHAALVVVYFIFGGGAVASKYGIYGASPVMYELVRELMVVTILWPSVICSMQMSPFPAKEDIPRVLWTGLCFFGNQMFFFVGLKLADPVAAAAWQASIPCCTALVSAIFGYEVLTSTKAAGTFVASVGAAVLALLGNTSTAEHPHRSLMRHLSGHAALLLGVLSVPGYILGMKNLLPIYSGVLVTSWAFTVSAFLMFTFCALVNTFPVLLQLICSDDSLLASRLCEADPLRLPPNMFWPLWYEVILCSLVAWMMLSWANRHVPASIVSLYSVLQPVASASVVAVVVCLTGDGAYGIQRPGPRHALSLTLIFAGLYLSLKDRKQEK